jgi:hypothetical protein
VFLDEDDEEDAKIESRGRPAEKPLTVDIPTIALEQPHKEELSFPKLAETLRQLTDTTKRLVKLDVVKDFFGHIVEHEIVVESV